MAMHNFVVAFSEPNTPHLVTEVKVRANTITNHPDTFGTGNSYWVAHDDEMGDEIVRYATDGTSIVVGIDAYADTKGFVG